MTHADEKGDVRPDEKPAPAPAPAPARRQKAVVRRPRLRGLTRALGEIVIVTIGILIAFSLDAWWDNRAMAKQEQIHLRALASDFQQNVDALRKLVELEKGISSSSLELLERQASSAPVHELMWIVFSSGRYEPVMGAYEALVNSAGLTLIRDDALRASLARHVMWRSIMHSR